MITIAITVNPTTNEHTLTTYAGKRMTLINTIRCLDVTDCRQFLFCNHGETHSTIEKNKNVKIIWG